MAHILQVPSWFPAYGADDGGFFGDIAGALVAAGNRVNILAPEIWTTRDLRGDTSGFLPDRRIVVESFKAGYDVFRLHSIVRGPRFPYRNPLFWAGAGISLFDAYVEHHGMPDIIHVHSCVPAGLLMHRLRKRVPAGTQFVLTEHAFGPSQPATRWWERHCSRLGITSADRLTAVSRRLADAMAAAYPDGRSWGVLPNVLAPVFANAPPPRPRKTGAPFRVVCVGRLSPEKGQDVLLDAWARAFTGAPSAQLDLIGMGSTGDALQQQAVALGLASQVSFTGHLARKDLRTALLKADAIVVPSRLETFCVALIEGFACGLPAVATTCGGPDDLVTAANGILVPVGDADALASGLRNLRDTMDAYDRRAIQKHARETWGPQAYARRFFAG